LPIACIEREITKHETPLRPLKWAQDRLSALRRARC
jgi:hypothetical protein